MIMFDFNVVLFQPSVYTSISSRKEIDCFKENGKLPLMTAPMDTVINFNNFEVFIDLGYTVVFPRTINFNDFVNRFDDGDELLLKTIKNHFFSYGLDEFKIICESKKSFFLPKNILVDIANGHMDVIKKYAIKFKEKYPHKLLMIGNIANPKTYTNLAETRCIDLLRIGIGNGSGCLTTKSVSIGYPMASLISEIHKEKVKFEKENKDCKAPLIIADGGMKEYADVIKSIGLGSDYVMLGSLLNKSIESAGDNFLWGIKLSQRLAEYLFSKGFPIKKYFRGMSTKEAQLAMGRDKTKLNTSEGVIRHRKVEYSLKKWTDNLVDYVKSAMSYTNSKNLNEFIGKASYNLITQNSYNRFNK
jgi:GMP reductase